MMKTKLIVFPIFFFVLYEHGAYGQYPDAGHLKPFYPATCVDGYLLTAPFPDRAWDSGSMPHRLGLAGIGVCGYAFFPCDGHGVSSFSISLIT